MVYNRDMEMMKAYFLVSCFVYLALGKTVTSDDNEVWNYVTVRPGAHMFYWHYTTYDSRGYKNVPYVLWLQGGPGGSGTGFGNFGEIGPLNVSLDSRRTTWLNKVSLLFIDNPVGTGYSYAETDEAFTTDVNQIANDLLTVMKAVLTRLPDYQTVPFYIFSESYGGKMTAAFSQVLYKAVSNVEIECNFKGFAMGDSWISPIDSVYSWAPYLYVNSLVDIPGRDAVMNAANKTDYYIKLSQYVNATKEWSVTEEVVEQVTNGVNFYNIQQWAGSQPSTLQLKYKHSKNYLDRLWCRHVGIYQADSLAELMNGPIREKLGIIPSNVTWGGQSGKVFEKQSGDFMKPVTEIVDDLINNTPLSVVVYSGQLDLIVDTLGTEQWVNRLTIAPEFRDAKRNVIINPDTELTGGFFKKSKNFSFYWILAAGHMVPADNGATALKMLELITTS